MSERGYKERLGILATALGIPENLGHEERYKLAVEKAREINNQLEYYIKKNDEYAQLVNSDFNRLLEIDNRINSGYFLINRRMFFKLNKFTNKEFCKIYDISEFTLQKFMSSKRKALYNFDEYIKENKLSKSSWKKGIIKEL